MTRGRVAAAALAVTLALGAPLRVALAQPPGAGAEEGMVQLDFKDRELGDVIETMARSLNKNFIYDDRVRGRVTIISPSPMPVEQAEAVFESVLQVKGFTIVETPGGAHKIIPLRDAKETSVETVASAQPPPNRDLFVTRLIPLRYIDAESIVNTLKPLVSKDAAMAAYAPTNTVILTESASNIRRLIAILESIDIELYKEELAVLRVEFADAATLAQQISEIYGAEVTGAAPATTRRSTSRSSRRSSSAATPAVPGSTPGAGKVRILTDDRTNSLIVLAPKTQLQEVRRLVRKLDVPVSGGGRIHVYYLQHADAEELAQVLTSMISGVSQPAPGATGQGAQAIRAAVTGLSEGISVTSDPATNSLIIQASQEGYNTLSAVIAKLDVARPQVLVEALIMEVDITDNEALGFNGFFKIVSGDTEYAVQLGSDVATTALLGPAGGLQALDASIPFLGQILDESSGNTIQAIIRLAAGESGTNILSAPHILTSDNEEAEIRIGDNIPIISSRVEAATGAPTVSTSVNVERQDIGVTLRVTPQITEGDSLRLDIFQEITEINPNLSNDETGVGDPSEVGVALLNRRVENTVVVSDNETIVIGGLVSDRLTEGINKVPWLAEIPFLGWLFKTTSMNLQKINLLVFLTPHIVRTPEQLLAESIRKREEFRRRSGEALGEYSVLPGEDLEPLAVPKSEMYSVLSETADGENLAGSIVGAMDKRYPLEMMRDIERSETKRRQEIERSRALTGPTEVYHVLAAVFRDAPEAQSLLTELIDAGYEGSLLSNDSSGTLLFEIHIGPYASARAAQRAVATLRSAYGLSPQVLVIPVEESP